MSRPDALSSVAEIARRHGFSEPAAQLVLDALARSGGTMAQVNHPEFRGAMQWMAGGMVMVGDLFDHALKARVDALARDLAAVAATLPPPRVAGSDDRSASSTRYPMGLDHPASTGAQNGMSYAYFPAQQRLWVSQGGRSRVHDTTGHPLNAFGQQQAGTGSFVASSPNGPIVIDSLPVLWRSDADDEPAPPAVAKVPTGAAATAPAKTSAPASADGPEPSPTPTPPTESTDVVDRIERLVKLREAGLLTAEEFTSAKAAVLGR